MEWKKVSRPQSPELAQFHSDSIWFSEHYDDLKAQYPDQWVAVYHNEVVGASEDGIAIIKDTKAKGLPVGHVFVRFVHGKKYPLHSKEYPRILGSSIRWHSGKVQ